MAIIEIGQKEVKEGFTIIQMDAIKGQDLILWAEEGKTYAIICNRRIGLAAGLVTDKGSKLNWK